MVVWLLKELEDHYLLQVLLKIFLLYKLVELLLIF